MEERIRTEFPGFIQSWYSDDFSTAGSCANILPAIVRNEELGTARGFYLESEKSEFVWSSGVTEDSAWLSTPPL